ncbi:MAG TPA: helix-turn-helix transcriptional regulator [Blastocatellia bacterium]|nr:helix-turn-helix transcriptional regulator [Blastocatellia bacterium]
MGLAEYVRRVMEEKHLSAAKVQKQSGGGISDTYVLKIAAGKVKRPSVSRLKALAKGLNVPEDEVFKAAGADVEKREWTARESNELLTTLLTNEELREVVLTVARMKQEELKRLAKYLKRDSS